MQSNQGVRIDAAPTSPRSNSSADHNMIKWRGANFEGPPSNRSTSQDTSRLEASFNASNGRSPKDIADFFNPEVFQIVLHNPTTSHQLLKYSQSRFCGENMEFLEKVDRCNTLIDELTKTMSDIHRSFTSVEAPRQLNVHPSMIKRMNADIKHTTLTTLPAMELIFSDAQESIEKLLATDVYPRFVKHQMTVSAVSALSADRGKYAGLGDCFCMTNPNKADNPIVYASDGFVKVTGYSRTDIVPRNCRFLQGSYTDRAAVKRVKTAIEGNRESVELLLNYRKNGEPFWNLLYVVPLLDEHGKTVFFLGGQINCSTTIHNRSDILRVLSVSNDAENSAAPTLAPASRPAVPPRKGFFANLRSKSSNKVTQTQEAGMEQDVISKIEKLNVKNQMKMFHSAYSKYLVLNYDSLEIRFTSPGVVDMLCVDPKLDPSFLGADVFRVLSQHSAYQLRDFRGRVKTALKAGRAMSEQITLSIRRSGMIVKGIEKFATHWTPLKDETGAVKFVIVTMASVAQNW